MEQSKEKSLTPIGSVPDIFIVGLSGSGKDTLGNYLKAYYNFRKMRLAGTIKQVICEKYGITEEELEELKRKDKKFREEHHIVSDNNGGQASSLNRANQIANRNSFDLSLVDDPEKQIVICDGRTFEECDLLLKKDFFTIFLSRTTEEYAKEGHFTENNLIRSEKIVELSFMMEGTYAESMLLVWNGGNYTEQEKLELTEKLHPNINILDLCENNSDCDAIKLITSIDEFFNW